MGILGVVMTKTILFISPTGTMDNGAEISIFNLMKFLVSKGFRVLNVFPDYRVPVQKTYLEQMKKAEIQAFGIPAVKWWWEEAPGGLPGTHNQRLESYRDNIKRIREILNQNKVDLVISNTANVFQGALAAAEENIRHFWLIHEFPEGEFGYYREKLNFINEFSDEIFAVTGALTQNLQRLLPERTIYSFAPFSDITIDEVSSNIDESRGIVCIGRLTERKNQLELIKAYRKINSEVLKLIFIGDWDTDYKEKCDQYISKYNLQNIEFRGHSSTPWAEVGKNKIAVFPSRMETFGLVYIESILNGIPTILSNNLGHLSSYHWMGEVGYLYDLGNLDNLSDMIQHILINFENECKESLAKVSLLKERYTLEHTYDQVLEMINSESIVKDKNLDEYSNMIKGKITFKLLFRDFIKSILTLKKI